jgi:hypothetical protein
MDSGFLQFQADDGVVMQLPLVSINGRETGIVFLEDGFEFEKFGTLVQFKYRPFQAA